jgi:trehalose 6-phosphate phosphatase
MSLPFFEYAGQRFDELVRPGILCAFDFDGTLAPIVTNPDQAEMPAPILRRLLSLQEVAPVAIITGRSLDNIAQRLGFEPDFVVGNHGIEGFAGWEEPADDYRKLCEQWHARLSRALADHDRFDPGILIEQKTYSLSVHYRMARDRRKTELALLNLFAGQTPAAHIIGGKCVFNLLPPHAPDKGKTMALLCEANHFSSALYIGDDVTDEDVFRLHRPDWLTIRIERSSDSDAEFYLHHRLDIVQLLDLLIRRLSPADATPRPAQA